MYTNFAGRGQGIQRGGYGRDVDYGGHDSTSPASADIDDGRRRMASSGGQLGAGAGPSEILAVNEWIHQRDRGIEHGQTEAVSNYQQMRVEQWKRKTGWDGDLNYPPPGFLEQEAERNHRVDFLERKEQRESGYMGARKSFMIPSHLEDHNMFCHQETQEAQQRAASWLQRYDDNRAYDVRRAQDLKQTERDRQHSKQMQHVQHSQFEMDRAHAREMQRAQYDHEARMRQLEIAGQQQAWRR